MFNTLEITPEEQIVENMTADLRAGAESEHKPKLFVKQAIKVENTAESQFTPEQIIAISKMFKDSAAKTIREAAYNPNADFQVLSKDKVVVTDFSKLSMDDVYDLSIPIEAKPFMSADALHVKLKDSTYEARWVNKNPQNLGNKMAKGFTYVVTEDLLDAVSIQTSIDSEGHYTFDDVVAMKIDKATYYRALRAAHERAIATTDTANSRKRATQQAQGFMNRESGFGADYQSAAKTGKMSFYDPGIEV